MSRSGSQTRRRRNRVLAAFTDDEFARVKRLVDDSGFSAGAFVRHTLLAIPLPRKRKSHVDHKALAILLHDMAELRAEMGKQGSNLNQLAHQANADRVPADFAEHLTAALDAFQEQGRTLMELRDACMRALGFERGGGLDD